MKNTKETLVKKLKELSTNNISVYQDLFILENLFREHFKLKGLDKDSFEK